MIGTKREIITRAEIGQQLKKNAKEVLLGLIVLLPLLCLIIAVAWGLQSIISNFFIPVISIILSVVLAIIPTVFLLLAAISDVYDSLRILQAASKGSYTVCEDVFWKVDHIHRHGWSRTTELEFLFGSGKKYVIDYHAKNDTRHKYIAEHSKQGDMVYLVTIDKKPDTPVLIYSGDLFKYEDRS